MLNQTDLHDLVNDKLLPWFVTEQARLDELDKWSRWDNTDVIIPRASTEENRSLVQLSKTPWLGLVVKNITQGMFVDGYHTSDAGDPEQESTAWKLWNENDLDGRQIAIHRAALAYGTSYGTALPGRTITGERTAILRGVSPRKMLAFYADPAEDDWPLYAIRIDGKQIRVLDDQFVYYLDNSDGAAKRKKTLEHGVGVCPVVRYSPDLDLDGRASGVVEPHIPLAKRIDKTTYDRLLTQHYNSWKVRTVAGMAEPDSEEDAIRTKLKLAHDSLMVSDSPDTKFGSLAETPLDGFIRAYESDIKTLASITRTPVHSLVGDLINLSADAIAAANAASDSQIAEIQRPIGKTHTQLLRIGAYIVGDIETANDSYAHVTWADTSIRSLETAAKALGLLAKELNIPQEALWSRVPGFTKTDVEEFKRLSAEADVTGRLLAALESSGTSA